MSKPFNKLSVNELQRELSNCDNHVINHIIKKRITDLLNKNQ